MINKVNNDVIIKKFKMKFILKLSSSDVLEKSVCKRIILTINQILLVKILTFCVYKFSN